MCAGEAPPDVIRELQSVRAALDEQVPSRTDANLLVATWNVRAFSDVTQQWHAGPEDSPNRDWHAVCCIAEIVSHFDVVAVQEVRRNVTALRLLADLLGSGWFGCPRIDVDHRARAVGQRSCRAAP